MFVYHATSNTCFENNIKENGLNPRGNKKSNWYTQNAESNSEVVYLGIYAQDHYGFRSALANNDNSWAVIKIDVDKLDSSNLRVDENWIDIQERGKNTDCPIDIRNHQKDEILKYKNWEDSLKKVGHISHVGKIKPNQFEEVRIYPIEENFWYKHFCGLFYLEPKERLELHDWILSGYNKVINYFLQNKKFPQYIYTNKSEWQSWSQNILDSARELHAIDINRGKLEVDWKIETSYSS